MAAEVPWVLTVMIGAAGWFVTHTVDRVVSSPTLEYEISSSNTVKGRYVQVELTNLTRDRVFDDVGIVLQTPPDGRIDDPRLRPVQPADEGRSAPRAEAHSATFSIDRMQPGSTYRLSARYAGSAVPVARITSDKAVLRAVPKSLETNFARFEIYYLFWLGLLGAAVMTVVAWTIGLFGSRPEAALLGSTDERVPVESTTLRAPKADDVLST